MLGGERSSGEDEYEVVIAMIYICCLIRIHPDSDLAAKYLAPYPSPKSENKQAACLGNI